MTLNHTKTKGDFERFPLFSFYRSIYFSKIFIIIFIYKAIVMAQKGKFINIAFPFKESNRGDFILLNNDDNKAIKSDLMHLILTRKGERLYLPDFGTNLLKFIYEPNDSLTRNDIKNEITDTVKKYLPNLQINEVSVEPSEDNVYHAKVRIDYTVTEGVFQEKDFIIIEI